MLMGRLTLDIAHLIGQTKIPAPDHLLAGSASASFATLGGSWGGCHGIIHPAVRRRAGLRLPLLRPYSHLRLPERSIAARAGGALLPQRRRRCGGQQRGPQPTHRRLSGLGGSLRPQSSATARVGRKGSAQGRSCPALATPHGGAPTASISSSRAWSRARPFASPCRNTRPKIPITGSWRTSAAASRIIIFTSAMTSSVQS